MTTSYVKYVTELISIEMVLISYFICCNSSENEKTFNFKCYTTFGSGRLVILPRDNIYERVNESFAVTCHINANYNISVKDVTFTKGFSGDSNSVESQVVDNQTLQLNILEEKPSRYKLLCRDSEKNYCMREVAIGYPPLDVQNFQCVSFNWKILECSYDRQENPVQGANENYYLSYHLLGKSIPGFKCKSGQARKCCHLKGDECWRWGDSEDFPLDSQTQFLNFTIASKNALGRKSYNRIINQYEIMIPDPATNFMVQAVRPSHLSLTWNFPTFLKLFPCGIIYRIKYETSGNENFILKKSFGQKTISKVISVPWPGQTYLVTVSLRSGNNSWEIGDQEDKWWSSPVTKKVTTFPLPPWRAPETTPGSFHVSNWKSKHLRTITLFWKKMKNHTKGGPGFTYYTYVFAEGKKVEIHPMKLTETYATFENLSTDVHYTFNIIPANSVGKGKASTMIEVEKLSELPTKAEFPLVILHPKEKVFHLKWFTKEVGETHFTLFWCQDDPDYNNNWDRPCKGSLSWKLLSNQTETNLTEADLGAAEVTKRIRFAISTRRISDSKSLSGGMVWAVCSVGDYDPEGSKVAPYVEVKEKTTSSILIEWQVDCKNWRGNPTKVEIFWCQGKHNITSHCSVQTLYQELDQNTLTLKNLKPDQNYTAWIRINFKGWNSELSHPIHFTTASKVLSVGTIILLSSATVVAVFFLLLIVIYSPKQLVNTWRIFKQIPNLPYGLLDPRKDNATNDHAQEPRPENSSPLLTDPSKGPLLSSKRKKREIEGKNKINKRKAINNDKEKSPLENENHNIPLNRLRPNFNFQPPENGYDAEVESNENNHSYQHLPETTVKGRNQIEKLEDINADNRHSVGFSNNYTVLPPVNLFMRTEETNNVLSFQYRDDKPTSSEEPIKGYIELSTDIPERINHDEKTPICDPTSPNKNGYLKLPNNVANPRLLNWTTETDEPPTAIESVTNKLLLENDNNPYCTLSNFNFRPSTNGYVEAVTLQNVLPLSILPTQGPNNFIANEREKTSQETVRLPTFSNENKYNDLERTGILPSHLSELNYKTESNENNCYVDIPKITMESRGEMGQLEDTNSNNQSPRLFNNYTVLPCFKPLNLMAETLRSEETNNVLPFQYSEGQPTSSEVPHEGYIKLLSSNPIDKERENTEQRYPNEKAPVYDTTLRNKNKYVAKLPTDTANTILPNWTTKADEELPATESVTNNLLVENCNNPDGTFSSNFNFQPPVNGYIKSVTLQNVLTSPLLPTQCPGTSTANKIETTNQEILSPNLFLNEDKYDDLEATEMLPLLKLNCKTESNENNNYVRLPEITVEGRKSIPYIPIFR